MVRQKTQSHFDLEFKKDVVRMVYESGKSVLEISRDMGVSSKNIYRWKKELIDEGIVKIDKSVKEQGEELRRLRKENADLKMERDILKKAMVIFTKDKK